VEGSNGANIQFGENATLAIQGQLTLTDATVTVAGGGQIIVKQCPSMTNTHLVVKGPTMSKVMENIPLGCKVEFTSGRVESDEETCNLRTQVYSHIRTFPISYCCIMRM